MGRNKLPRNRIGEIRRRPFRREGIIFSGLEIIPVNEEPCYERPRKVTDLVGYNNKIGYVLAYAQGIAADEDSDNAFCLELLERLLSVS